MPKEPKTETQKPEPSLRMKILIRIWYIFLCLLILSPLYLYFPYELYLQDKQIRNRRINEVMDRCLLVFIFLFLWLRSQVLGILYVFEKSDHPRGCRLNKILSTLAVLLVECSHKLIKLSAMMRHNPLAVA